MEIYELPPARRELVFRVRRQIAEGTYDTPDKLECALERLFDDLAPSSARDIDAPS